MKLFHTFGEHRGTITDVVEPERARRMLVLNHARVPTQADIESVAAAPQSAPPAKKKGKRSRRGEK